MHTNALFSVTSDFSRRISQGLCGIVLFSEQFAPIVLESAVLSCVRLLESLCFDWSSKDIEYLRFFDAVKETFFVLMEVLKTQKSYTV